MRANKNLTPVWIIYSDGKRLDVEHEGALQSIMVNDCLNGISSFSLVFDTAGVKVQEKGLISSGSLLSIHLGYKDDVEEVFSGEVHTFRTVFPEVGVEQLEVCGSNVLYKLDRASHYRSFEGKAPSEVIKGLIDTYSLKAEVEDFGVSKLSQSEENLTDYEYLIEQAEAYGKQVYASGSTIYVKNEITISTDEVIFEWGKSLVSFKATQNTRGLMTGVDYVGWDDLKKESFAGKAELSDIPVKVGGSKYWNEIYKSSSGNLRSTEIDLNSEDSEEAKQLAIGMLQNNSYTFCHAHGIGEGNYRLRPGMRVMLKMVGEMNEGEYLAEVVTHRFDHRNGYTVEFDLKRNMCL